MSDFEGEEPQVADEEVDSNYEEDIGSDQYSEKEDEEEDFAESDLTFDDLGDDEDGEDNDISQLESIRDALKREDVKQTGQFLTKYERARIIGERAAQLQYGAPSTVDTTGIINVIEIAEKELREGKLPLALVRPYPGRNKVTIQVSRLIDVNKQA